MPSSSCIFFTIMDTEARSVSSKQSIEHWEHDPANPRQWAPAKKWQALTIVRNFLLVVLRLIISPPGIVLCVPSGFGDLYDERSFDGDCHKIWYCQFV
jgi:hypothetical protein